MIDFDEEVARHAALLPPGLTDWIRAHQLTEPWAPLLGTTAAWIASAAPPWATPEQRALACMDLGTCFFVLDDSGDDDALGRHADLERVAAGIAPDPGRPLQRAFAALFDRLTVVGGPLDHYLALRREFAAALRRRHAIRTERRAIGVEAYLALRETTIYLAPWLSLWELLGGFVLSRSQRALVAPAFVPANRWQVLENDRMSVARDLRTGTPNLVALVAAERGLSLADATVTVGDRAAADLAAYVVATAALRATVDDRSVGAYLDALDRSVDGAARHYRRVDPDRYRVTPASGAGRAGIEQQRGRVLDQEAAERGGPGRQGPQRRVDDVGGGAGQPVIGQHADQPASHDLVAGDDPGQRADPGAGHHRLAQEVGVVAGDAAGDGEPDGAAGAVEREGRGAGAAGQEDVVVVGQLVQAPGRAAPGEVGRAGVEAEIEAGELARHQR